LSRQRGGGQKKCSEKSSVGAFHIC
jgi:hypothetical protein